MIDLFHLQLIRGNITNTLNDLKSYIGHVQVSVRWSNIIMNFDSLLIDLKGSEREREKKREEEKQREWERKANKRKNERSDEEKMSSNKTIIIFSKWDLIFIPVCYCVWLILLWHLSSMNDGEFHTVPAWSENKSQAHRAT